MKFRKKPVVIEAVQFKGGRESLNEIVVTLRLPFHIVRLQEEIDNKLAIATLEGIVTADVGDWIIKGVKGEFYPCKPDIFDMTYEFVSV